MSSFHTATTIPRADDATDTSEDLAECEEVPHQAVLVPPGVKQIRFQCSVQSEKQEAESREKRLVSLNELTQCMICSLIVTGLTRDSSTDASL